MNQPQAFLDGKFVPEHQASISLSDVGFQLGVTIAERLRTFGGSIFKLEDHLGRLLRSLEIVGIDAPWTPEQLAEIAVELVQHNQTLIAPGDDLGLTILVTPGSNDAPTRDPAAKDPAAKDATPGPLLGMHTTPLPFAQWAESYAQGEALVTTSIQQVSDRSWPRALKCRSRVHYYLADSEAQTIDPGARAFLHEADGTLTEATTANVLLYFAEEGLVSAPLEKVLPGISMRTLLRLAEQQEVSTVYRDIRPEDVARADEVLLTTTSSCVLPVVRFNKGAVGGGIPGPFFRRILTAWSELVGTDIEAQALHFAER